MIFLYPGDLVNLSNIFTLNLETVLYKVSLILSSVLTYFLISDSILPATLSPSAFNAGLTIPAVVKLFLALSNFLRILSPNVPALGSKYFHSLASGIPNFPYPVSNKSPPFLIIKEARPPVSPLPAIVVDKGLTTKLSNALSACFPTGAITLP